MKFCNKCGIQKTLIEFPKRASCLDGHRDICKVCKALQDQANRQKRLGLPGGLEKERQRAADIRSQRTEHEKERVKRREIETCRRNRQKEKDRFFAKHGCTRQELKWKADGEEFITDGLSRNGNNKYGYFAVDYQGVQSPVILWCNTHKSYFTQTPHDHKIGRGCPECGKIATGNALRKSQEDFLKEAEAYCGDRFTFEDAKYVSFIAPVDVTCKIHGSFPIRPSNLFSGKGCPACAKYGYRNALPGSLYVLYNGELTKIGITNNSVESRVKQLNRKGKGFSIVCQHLFDSGKHASAFEATLLSELRKEYLQPADKFDGSTECFLGLDPYELANDIFARLPKHTEETNDNYRSYHTAGNASLTVRRLARPPVDA